MITLLLIVTVWEFRL